MHQNPLSKCATMQISMRDLALSQRGAFLEILRSTASRRPSPSFRGRSIERLTIRNLCGSASFSAKAMARFCESKLFCDGNVALFHNFFDLEYFMVEKSFMHAPPGKQRAQPVATDGFWTVWKTIKNMQSSPLSVQTCKLKFARSFAHQLVRETLPVSLRPLSFSVNSAVSLKFQVSALLKRCKTILERTY